MKKREIGKSITEFTPLDSKPRKASGLLRGKHLTGFIDEDAQWLSLTPAQRILETTKLWEFYIALGGSLDPKPDTQSPFYVKEVSR